MRSRRFGVLKLVLLLGRMIKLRKSGAQKRKEPCQAASFFFPSGLGEYGSSDDDVEVVLKLRSLRC